MNPTNPIYSNDEWGSFIPIKNQTVEIQTKNNLFQDNNTPTFQPQIEAVVIYPNQFEGMVKY